MNLKGVEFINYLYIIVLSLGAWVNVNIFSSIQWFGILFYLYNVFCIDERGMQYFQNLRFLIVFLISFSNLIMILQSYMLYEYLTSPSQATYYLECLNLGFEYTKDTNILLQTSINLGLALSSFVVGIIVFIQLNRNQDIFEGKIDDQGQHLSRISQIGSIGPSFQQVLVKYDWAQRFLVGIFGLLVLMTIIIDGVFGVFYCGILACWLLEKLNNKQNDLNEQIKIDLKYLSVLKFFSLLTCYCGILWKLNIFVEQYKGVVYMINGYISGYTFLFIGSFILELLLLMFTIYTQDLLRQLQPTHIIAIKLKQIRNHHNNYFMSLLASNYFGIITCIALVWASVISSLLMAIPLIILLLGSILRRQKDIKLRSAISINYFSYCMYFLMTIFNIPFLFRYVTSSLFFNLLGLHSYNEEEQGIDGLVDRMSSLGGYQIFIFSIYLITQIKVYEKVLKKETFPKLASRQESLPQSQFNPTVQRKPPADDEDIQNSETSVQQIQEEEDQYVVSSLGLQGQGVNIDSQSQISSSHLQRESFVEKKPQKSSWSFITNFYLEIKKICIVHFDKAVVCLLFAASLNSIDILHAFFMVGFLLFVFMQTQYWKTLMKIIIAYSYIAIIIHYVAAVLFKEDAISISSTLIFIGVKENPKMDTFLTRQVLDILIVLVCSYCQSNIIYSTVTFRKYNQQNEELEKESVPLDRKVQIISQFDALSLFFVDNGVWMCYVSLLSVGLIPPANILSLGYLLFLQVFISFTMIENEEKKAFQKILKGWPLLIMISTFILIVRYFSLFVSIEDFLLQFIPSEKLVEDIGLSDKLSTYQLIGNCLILLVLSAQKRIVDTSIYQIRSNQPSDTKIDANHRTLSYALYKLKIQILSHLSTHFSKMVLFYGLIVSILHSSAAGIAACFIQMLVFLWGRETYWRNVWIPLWVISFTFMIIQYLFQFHFIGDNLTDQEKAWAGLFSINSIKFWIFLGLYILQQILCVLMRKLQKFEAKMQDPSYISFKEDYQNIKKLYNQAKEKIDHSLEQEALEKENQIKMKQEQLQESEREQGPPQRISISNVFEEIDYLDTLPEQEKVGYLSYLEWHPYRKAEKDEENMKEFFKYVGYDLSIFVIIVAAYFEMNAISLIHIFLASFFALFSYVINSAKNYNPTHLKFVNYVWRTINYIILIDITRKYFLSLWFPAAWKVNKPWDSWSFTCDKNGRKGFATPGEGLNDFQQCQNDWKDWLSLEDKNNLYLILDVINFQIMVVYDRYFSEILNHNGPKRCHENIESGDAHDFTRNKKNVMSYVKLFIFGYFYQIPIMTYFIIGSLNTISSYTDLISIAYLFISIYLLFRTKMLLSLKNDIWKYILGFNTSVMCLLCMYQAPFFPCPIDYPDNRYYLTSEECLNFQNSENGELQVTKALKNKIETIEDLYALLSYICGFNKSPHFTLSPRKELFMILFCLFGLLQKNIWNHPYTEHYIEPFIRDQKKKQKINAVEVVSSAHFKRIYEHNKLEMELEVYQSIEQRVEQKVLLWDKVIKKNKNNEDGDVEAAQNLLNEQDQTEKLDSNNDEIIYKAERIVLESDVPIHLKGVIKALQKYPDNPEDLKVELDNLKTTSTKLAFDQVFENPVIGIAEYKEDIKQLLGVDDQIKEIVSPKVEEIPHSPPAQPDQVIEDNLYIDDQDKNEESKIEEKKEIELQNFQEPIQKKKTKGQLKQMKESIKITINNALIFLITDVDPNIIEHCRKENSLQLTLFTLLKSKFHLICLFSFLLNAIQNSDILSLFYPIVYFLYTLIESPFPSRTFWKIFMSYTILVISCKFLYQLPVFCGSPPYYFSLFDEGECSSIQITREQALNRIDFKIGIKKYMGPSSYPHNEGFFSGIIWDYLVLLCLLIQRYLMSIEGKWTYVQISKDDLFIPQFRDPIEEYAKYNSLNIQQKLDKSFSYDGITDATITSINKEENILEENLLEENIDQEDAQKLLDQDGQQQGENNNQIETQQQGIIVAEEENIDEERKEDALDHIKRVSTEGREPQEQDELLQEFFQKKKIEYNSFELFFYRIFPFYLIEKQKEKSYFGRLLEDTNYQKQSSKPGKNFYIHQFVSSFVVLGFFMIFFGQMTKPVLTQNSQNPPETRFSASIVLIILFSISVMVIDRILYKMRRACDLYQQQGKEQLKENQIQSRDGIEQHASLLKFILHIIITIALHYYLFFVITHYSRSTLGENSLLVICYFLVSIYLYYSALQIKSGYPQMVVGSIFSRDTSLTYRISYNIYRALPFLYELRSVIDWTFSTTSLDIFQWFKMEDAYANLYSVKAEMSSRKETHKLGEVRGFGEKCSFGFLLLVVLLLVILLPIFLFSNLNPAVELNNLVSGGLILSLQVIGKEKELNFEIYQNNGVQIDSMSESQFNSLRQTFYGIESLWQERLQILQTDSQSDAEFSMTQNALKELISILKSDSTRAILHFNWKFGRPKPKGKEEVDSKSQYTLPKESISELIDIVTEIQKGKSRKKSMSISLISAVPFFLQIPDNDLAIERDFEPTQKKDLYQLNTQLPKEITSNPKFDPNVFTSVNVKLGITIDKGISYWTLSKETTPYFDDILEKQNDNRLSIIILSEMAFSSVLSSMSDNLSVVGIYLTVVLTVGRFLRLYFDRVSMRCIWEEMPRTDDLFDLCQSIYIARLQNDLLKEERNYELLIRILRSPEILLRLTGNSLYKELN